MANKNGCTACSTGLDMFLHKSNTGIIKFSNISMIKNLPQILVRIY